MSGDVSDAAVELLDLTAELGVCLDELVERWADPLDFLQLDDEGVLRRSPVLQASSQVALLEPWFENAGKSLTKSPKLYFCDTGLLLFLLNIRTLDELLESPLRGAVFETAVYCELRKRLGLRHEVESLYFLRDRTREVDFLLHQGGRFRLMECKWSENPAPEDARGMEHASQLLGPERILSKTIICRTPRPFPLGPGVWATNLEELKVE